MQIKYSSHAVERMMRRDVSTKEVELIISDPDGAIKQSRDKVIYYKKIKGRKDNMLAAVTVLQTKSVYEVITVMIDFEVKE